MNVYGFSTCEKERACEGVLWGKFTQVSCSSNAASAYFTQRNMNLGCGYLNLGGGGSAFFFFLHADFPELLKENTMYTERNFTEKMP